MSKMIAKKFSLKIINIRSIVEHSEPSQNFSSTYILSFVRILNFCDLYQKLITYCIFEKMILLNNIKQFSCLIMRKNYNGRLSPKLDEVRNKRYMIIAPNKISISSILFFQPPITWVLSKIFSAAVQYSYVHTFSEGKQHTTNDDDEKERRPPRPLLYRSQQRKKWKNLLVLSSRKNGPRSS